VNKAQTPSKNLSKSRLTVGYLAFGLQGIGLPLWQGTLTQARHLGLNLICFPGANLLAGNSLDTQQNIVYEMISRERIAGLISWASIIGRQISSEDNETFHTRYDVPFVTIAKKIKEAPVVLIDNYQGMRQAMKHLIEVHGYRRIAYIRGPEDHVYAQERYRGYREALQDSHISIDENLITPIAPFGPNTGKTGIRLLMDERHLRPGDDFDAIAAVSEDTLFGALEVLNERGIVIPDQVAAIGFDDTILSQTSLPPVTTVASPFYQLGYQALAILNDLLEGNETGSEILVPGELIVRQSCGCMMPSVELAAAEETKTAASINDAISATTTTSAWDTLFSAAQGIQAPQRAERLWKSFFESVQGNRKGNFLNTLDQLLREDVLAEKDIFEWQNVISILRTHALAGLDEEATRKAESLFQQARVLIGETSQRAHIRYEQKNAQHPAMLQRVNEKLVTSFDLQDVMNVLAEELPNLGIPSCYLSLYETPQTHQHLKPAPAFSRLVMAYTDNQRIEVGAQGISFPTTQLVPEAFLPKDRQYSWIVCPLFFQENQLGFTIFEIGPNDANVYESLRSQISSVLQGAMLMHRVEERSAELTRQNYILDMFMDNVPDSIYFKDAESRFTRMNKALLDKFALRDDTETYGKTDFDFFPQEQAQAKYEQEQQIIQTGNPILNVEEPDGEGSWALTTKMPLRDEKGVIIGTFGISRDITDLVKAKQAAEMAREEADTARQAAEIEKERAEVALDQTEKAHKAIEAAHQALAAQMWQTSGVAQLNNRLRGEQDIPTLSNNVIQQLCQYLDAHVGILYIAEDDLLQLTGTYAYTRRNKPFQQLQLGENLVGQAALEKRIITERIPSSYITEIFENTGELLAQNMLAAPFVYEKQTIGVVQIETFNELTPAQLEFLNNALESMAIAFMTAQARKRVNELYAQTRQQAEELQAQEEELRATNEELEAQTESLRASETRLKQNQAELEAANANLEEKTEVLQKQQSELDRQNQILRDAQQELQRKAEELAQASKYKSEFLANMSHELRTPLNSMLILAGMLAKNDEGNLTPDQVESAQVIYSGGTDLLNLINEILDLAKVEAGKMEFRFAPMPWNYLVERMNAQFIPLAQRKGLQFITQVADDLPPSIVTDEQRLAQIIKNLLSNAFKFTEQGSIRVAIQQAPGGANQVAISVTDTGIGMTPEQQKVVFEAFQQADGSTSRQYGGTGLGLTITREMTHRLGGQVALTSEPGKGSTFTIYLPLKVEDGKVESETLKVEGSKSTVKPSTFNPSASSGQAHQHTIRQSAINNQQSTIPDDRENLQPADRVLLIVEDDPKFAKIVLNYAHKKHFKAIVAGDGESALTLARNHLPAAIILDLKLPGMSGWDVLDAIKDDPDLRHIPVHIISVGDEDVSAYQRGAMGFLTKPVNQKALDGAFGKIESFISSKIRSLLIVEDDASLRLSVRKLLEGSDIAITEAATGQAAIDHLATQAFDCMILDLSLPDISGFELLNRLDSDESLPKCPVIVYTGKELSPEENQELLKYADSVIVKGVKSPERLLDETALFLHRVVADLPEDQQRTIRKLHNREAVLQGKQLLIVDDDARNAFALSKLLSDKGVKMYIATSANKALEKLEHVEVSLILTDIMMPGMDGYEFIKTLRSQPRFQKLPIIALTAKAMKGDREKCIEAGANDYLSKPIDPERLFSMLRVWLSRE
jgi:PAS domain S-box-containing protein